MVVWTGGTLLIPKFLGDIFDLAQKCYDEGKTGNTSAAAEARQKMDSELIFIVAIAAAIPIVSSIKLACAGVAGERFLRRLRAILFAVLLDQPTSFFDESLSGEIVNRMAADTEAMQKFVSFALPHLTHSVLLMIACFVLMVHVEWRLALGFWAALPPGLIIFGMESVALKRAKKIYQELLADAGAKLSETVLQIRTVRCFAAEVRTQRQFRLCVDAAFKIGKKVVGIRIVFETFLNYCFQITYIAVYRFLLPRDDFDYQRRYYNPHRHRPVALCHAGDRGISDSRQFDRGSCPMQRRLFADLRNTTDSSF